MRSTGTGLWPTGWCGGARTTSCCDAAPADAAVRECWEEAGLRTTVGHEVTHFENADTNGRDLTFHTITYRLLLPDLEPDVHLSAEEHDDFRWLTRTKA